MKKNLTIVFLSIFIAGSACTNGREQTQNIRASGHIITKELTAISFDALDASRSVQAILIPTGDKIRIEADDNIIDYVTVEKTDDTLKVSVAPSIQLHRATIRVIIPTDGNISALKASSSAKIICEIPLTGKNVSVSASSSAEIIAAVTAENCHINAASSAEIHAGIHAPECTIKASSSAEITLALMTRNCEVKGSSSGEITLSGEADECHAKCSSSSDLSANQFIVKQYNITASSSAKAEIHCTEKLTARASSAGSIEYTGKCIADSSLSGAGSIIRN